MLSVKRLLLNIFVVRLISIQPNETLKPILDVLKTI